MKQPDRLLALARQQLSVTDAQGRVDLWLWEHSERVMRLTQLISRLPEFAPQRPDLAAVAAAALFHDAGWAVQFAQGKFDRWQILTRPTSDIQRELGAALLQEQAAHLVSGDSLRRAVQAIRQCNDRSTTLVEAQVVAEAENFDEIGTLAVLRQLRQYLAEGRPLEQFVAGWVRQKEYRFWEARINDSLRLETTRALARERLTAVDQFMHALQRDLSGAELEAALRALVPAGAMP